MKSVLLAILLASSVSFAQESDAPFVVQVHEGRVLGEVNGVAVATDVGPGLYLNATASKLVAQKLAYQEALVAHYESQPLSNVAHWQVVLAGALLIAAGVGAGVFITQNAK